MTAPSNDTAAALERALDWLRPQQPAMEKLLGEMVEISSHTPDRDGNTRVATHYAEATLALTRGGLQGGVVPSSSGKYGAHVVLGNGGSRAVALIGHHDTVFPASVFTGFREDGALLRGPGVLDMKGGLVVVAYALGALAEAGVLERVPLRVVSISDEEVGSFDGREHVLAAARESACALVFESGRAGDQIVTRRKGIAALTVTAHGKGAHAGNNHADGVNAIWALARFITRAQELTDYERGITINVGKVVGGMGKNTVPDHAEALVDIRFLTNRDGDSVLGALRDAGEAAAEKVFGARIDVEGGITRAPLERTDASAVLLSEYAACARQSGLGADEAPLIGGGSDANTVAEVGLPAIDGLGPRGKGFHTVDEFIERSTLLPKTEALIRFLVGRMQ
jgi:glutamate carboxypeptidase